MICRSIQKILALGIFPRRQFAGKLDFGICFRRQMVNQSSFCTLWHTGQAIPCAIECRNLQSSDEINSYILNKEKEIDWPSYETCCHLEECEWKNFHDLISRRHCCINQLGSPVWLEGIQCKTESIFFFYGCSGASKHTLLNQPKTPQ